MMNNVFSLSDDEVRALDLYWRAANYLGAAQIYLRDNCLLTDRLRAEHIKPRLLGHWGTVPGVNFVYTHPKPLDPAYGPERVARHGPRPRRAGQSGQPLSGRDAGRVLPGIVT